MPSYDRAFFSPPAPLARVVLRHPLTLAIVADVPMLLDSGADVTLLPQASVDQLHLQAASNESYELVGFDGSRSVARAVQADLLFLGCTFKGQFLLSSQEWGLLGRDILNHLSLLLDGPQLRWSDLQRRES